MKPCFATFQQVRSKLTNLDKVTILSEALPLLQRFRGKTIVVKYGEWDFPPFAQHTLINSIMPASLL